MIAVSNHICFPYSKSLNVNDYPGVDPLGVEVCHTALQAALDSNYYKLIFDGIYRIQGQLNIPEGKHVVLRAGTSIRIYGNVAADTISCFGMGTYSGLELEPGSELTVETSGTVTYIGIQAQSGAYGWTIEGRGRIHGFGKHGIYINNPVTPDEPRIRGNIKDVFIQDISAVTGSFGDGIKILIGAEYINFVNCEVYNCAGNGIYILGANNPIIGGSFKNNTLYGIRIDGAGGNTDHFHVTGATSNHNDGGAIRLLNVDTGISFSGCSFFGNKLMDVNNCKGVSLNGCGVALEITSNVVAGASGGAVNINGGHSTGATQAAFLSALTGGGTVNFNNVLDIG